MHLDQWRNLDFNKKIAEIGSSEFSWQEVNIGSGNGLAPNSQQAFTWTNVGQDLCGHSATMS